MSEYDRHERAMYDALREDEEARRQRPMALKKCYGVLYAANTSPLGLPEYVSLYRTKEEAQREQIRNGSRIVRVELYEVKS